MIFIVLTIFITLYLVTGVHVARIKYSKEHTLYIETKDTLAPIKRKLDNKRRALDDLSHNNWCNLSNSKFVWYGCNCRLMTTDHQLRHEINTIEDENNFVDPATVAYWTVIGWPVYAVQSYIFSGINKRTDIVSGEVIEPEPEPERQTSFARANDPLLEEIVSTWDALEAKAKADAKADMEKASGWKEKSVKKASRDIDFYEILDGAGKKIRFAADPGRAYERRDSWGDA